MVKTAIINYTWKPPHARQWEPSINRFPPVHFLFTSGYNCNNNRGIFMKYCQPTVLRRKVTHKKSIFAFFFIVYDTACMFFCFDDFFAIIKFVCFPDCLFGLPNFVRYFDPALVSHLFQTWFLPLNHYSTSCQDIYLDLLKLKKNIDEHRQAAL